MSDKTSLALDALAIGLHVFPVDPKTARPLTKNGLLDASDDPEVVATWFSGDFAGARIGVAAGASGLVIADLDRKNSKDGFEAIEEAWLELPESWGYPTPNGGQHVWYAAPEGIRLTGNADYRNLSGFDRRGGNSFVILHTDTLPDSRDAFAPAPVWLLDEAGERAESGFSGTITDWLAEFGQGEPNERMKAAIDRIPTGDISHSDMVADQFNIIRLAAEGSEGGAVALAALREAWLARDPALHSTPQQDWDYKFDEALESGIAKYGSELGAIAALPSYLDCLNLVPAAIAEAHLFGPEKPKRAWFDAIKALVPLSLTDQQISAIMWMAPAVKTWSRDFGIDYLAEQIELARTKAVADAAPRENPSLLADKPASVNKAGGLLTEQERELVALCPTFVDRYLVLAAQRVNVLNRGYHVQNAWTILSMAFGMAAFLPYKSRAVGLNLYQIAVGESSSGKSESISIRDAWIREFFAADMSVDLGSAVSTEWLHEKLITRDQKVSLFNADEAAKVFRKMNERGGYLNGLEDDLAHYYEGYVTPVGKKSADKEIVGKTAIVSFNLAMFGTPKRVTEALTKDMWLSGFLARVLWTIGDEPADNDAAYDESQVEVRVEEDEYDPVMRAMAVEFRQLRRVLGVRRPVLATDEALKRMAANRKAMTQRFKEHENWDLLEPSVKRLGDVIRKCSALLALSAGREQVTLVDALTAISYAEVWLDNVETISRQISDSVFTRDCDTIELFIRASGGSVSETKIAHRFRMMGTGDVRDLYSRLEALRVQGRTTRQEVTASKGVWWAIND